MNIIRLSLSCLAVSGGSSPSESLAAPHGSRPTYLPLRIPTRCLKFSSHPEDALNLSSKIPNRRASSLALELTRE